MHSFSPARRLPGGKTGCVGWVALLDCVHLTHCVAVACRGFLIQRGKPACASASSRWLSKVTRYAPPLLPACCAFRVFLLPVHCVCAVLPAGQASNNPILRAALTHIHACMLTYVSTTHIPTWERGKLGWPLYVSTAVSTVVLVTLPSARGHECFPVAAWVHGAHVHVCSAQVSTRPLV